MSKAFEIISLALLFSCCAFDGARLHACLASPFPFAARQPDGTRIELYLRGDCADHWLEDAQGYTVLRAGDAFVYAELTRQGDLAPTRLRAGIDDPRARGLARGLLPDYTRRTASRAEFTAARAAFQSVTQPQAVSGEVKNLVLLLRFSNHLSRPLPSAADYERLFNAPGGDPLLAPTGSVRDYYLETSRGALELNSTIVSWLDLPQSEAYYAAGVSGLGVTIREALIAALEQADALVDFAQFDADSDGRIDAITFIHSGYGAEWGGTDSGGAYFTNRIWSHRWALPDWTSAEGVKVRDYHINPGLWELSGERIGRIGVICHELGHFFGLPDLYDTDNSSSGIGAYGLMANSWGFDGSQLHPPHFCAWSKIELGWATVRELELPGAYTIDQTGRQNDVYRIAEYFPPGEYLLLENRQPAGFESAMPQGGLCIWHVDENKEHNRDEGYPGQAGWPQNNRHYRVALLQADGEFDLERKANRGDGGDVFHAGGANWIGAGSVPNTDSYQDGAVTTNTHLIFNIGQAGATMTFTYAAGAPPPAQFALAPAALFFTAAPGAPAEPQRVILTNTGWVDLQFDAPAFTIAGADADAFALLGETAAAALPPGASREIWIQFTPAAAGGMSAELRVCTANTAQPLSIVDLSGAAGGAVPLSGPAQAMSAAQSPWTLYE